jgi:hypothetical protein
MGRSTRLVLSQRLPLPDAFVLARTLCRDGVQPLFVEAMQQLGAIARLNI